MVLHNNCMSLKKTFNVPSIIPKPNTKIAVTTISGITNNILKLSWKFKKNIIPKNGTKVSNKFITAANMAESGKLNGCKLTDFRIEALSINEVSTWSIEAEIKFQKIKPLRAYNEKFSMWLISLKTITKITRNSNGLSILQKTPNKEFLYLNLMVFRDKLSTAFLNPMLSSVFSNVIKFLQK